MKKLLGIIGAAALVAGFAPYSFDKNDETGESSVKALLWKLTTGPDPETGKPTLSINVGPTLPVLRKKNEEEELFADEITVTYTPVEEVPVEDTPCCEEGPCCPECCVTCCCEEEAAPCCEAPCCCEEEAAPVEETPAE